MGVQAVSLQKMNHTPAFGAVNPFAQAPVQKIMQNNNPFQQADFSSVPTAMAPKLERGDTCYARGKDGQMNACRVLANA